MGLLFALSMVLALASRSLSISLATPIPVADFYDRVSRSSANGLYFGGMYVASLAVGIRFIYGVFFFAGVSFVGLAIGSISGKRCTAR